MDRGSTRRLIPPDSACVACANASPRLEENCSSQVRGEEHRLQRRFPADRRQTTMPVPITVCLVDDHAVVRQGVRAFLAAQPDISVIGEAGTGAAAVQLVTAYAPMVVLVDLVMPEMDGVEITRRIKQIRPSTQVIVLTSFLTDEHLFPALRAGALSYLLKDAGAEEIAAAIRKAAHHEAVLHPRIAARLAQQMRRGRKPTINPFTELSDRELDVLRLIAEGLS